MKKYLIPILNLLTIQSFAQLGINTTTPHSTLEVNGSLQITKDLNVGGSATKLGDSGRTDTFLISQGNNLPPKWATPVDVKIPSMVAIGRALASTTTIPANTNTKLDFTSRDYSNADVIAYNANDRTYTIKKAGYYLVNSNCKCKSK